MKPPSWGEAGLIGGDTPYLDTFDQFSKQGYTCTSMYTLKYIQHETDSKQENCLLHGMICVHFYAE